MTKLYSIILLVLFASSAYGTPSITGVIGTVSDGQSITISGSSFSTGPSVTFFDNFESGTAGQSIATGVGSATIGQWESMGAVTPQYSSDTYVSGNKAFKAVTQAGNEGHTNGFISLPDVTESFISWWCYVPLDSPWSGEGEGNGINWKRMWLIESKTQQTSPYNDLVFSLLHTNSTTNAVGGNYTPLAYPDTEPWQSSSMVKGTWHRYVAWIKDGSSSDGTIKIWELTTNGLSLVKSVTNKSTIYAGGVRKYLSVNAYTREMTVTQAIQLFDDVYVATGANAQARIELGTGCTGGVYTACTNLSILTPTSWAAGSITATVRRGSLTDTSMHLFVIDSAGAASAGYAILGTDVTAPVTSHNGQSRSATAQTVTLSANETAATTYCTGAAACTPSITYSAPITIKPGKFMCYWSTDSASNQEATKCQYFGWPIKCQ